jgi:predicted extracellular nuclease
MAYSYVYGGQLGTLDSAFATASLLPFVTGATAWHINGDEAVALNYKEEAGKPARYYQPDPFQASDHDPVVVGLDLPDASSSPGHTKLVWLVPLVLALAFVIYRRFSR